MRLRPLLVLLALLTVLPALAVRAEEMADPLASPLWPEIRTQILGNAPYVFDARVEVTAPPMAENSAQLPVAVRVHGLGRVREIVLFADYNPIPKILALRPLAAKPYVATRFKINMASPVRAAALAEDGLWHVGGVWVDAAGGGCTLPSAASADAAWQSRLGETQARAWLKGKGKISRIRLRMIHPMDTGLAAGIPAFYLEHSRLRAVDGRVLAELDTFEPVSENPILTLEVEGRAGGQGLLFEGRDNNGNEFKARIREGGPS
jgi:sulfur-oxidizing protein SoxY